MSLQNPLPAIFLFPNREIALAIVIVLTGCGVNVTAPSTSETQPPQSSEVAAPPARDVSNQAVRDQATGEQPQSAPRIEVDATTHDFGEMNPLQIGQHEFIVRNVGDAPLELKSERSTCKCTVAELADGAIPPGGEAKVVLHWQTTKNNRRFEESATLATNDPNRASLTFKVTGDVLVHVGANPPELVVPGIHPGKGASVTTLVTSQVWDEFRIEGLDCSIEGCTTTVADATREQLEKLKANSGHKVTIHIPPSLPQGSFNHWVRFQIIPPDGDEKPKTYELPIRGRVLRPLAVYGRGIDHTGRVSLGVVKSQEGHRRRLVMKVRDPDPELRVERISCHPSFLQIDVTSFTTKANKEGLYYLDIKVPKSSPVGRFQAGEAGEIKIDFDHPRISNLELTVDFAVSGHHRRSPSNQQTTKQSTHGVLARRTNR